MTQELDERLSRFLLGDTPPARDPMFRLRVLARRERQRFLRRSVMLFAAALACIVFFCLVTATHAGTLQAAVALASGVVLAVSFSLYAPAVTLIFRSLNSGR
ncbi:MAG: hypothetical protein ABI645_09000 [Pseudomonadota bacterium]